MPEWIPSILVYAAAILCVFVLFKVFSWPIKTFFKLLTNALIGAAILLAINYFGHDLMNFTLPITWWSSLTVGVLGIPGVIVLVVLKFIL